MHPLTSLQDGLPAGYRWINEPPIWDIDGETLRVDPAAETDLFFAPDGSMVRDNAALLATDIHGDFTMAVRVSAQLVAFGDAGAITIRAASDRWAKLRLERSPVGDINVVSVVTDGVSDDSTGEMLQEPACYLRVTRAAEVIGMHYSLDGAVWRFCRTFRMRSSGSILVGLQAQAPFEGGAHIEFDSWSVTAEPVRDFRSGE